MKVVFAFIAGTLVGAAVALMLAPKSGIELRAQMAEESERERERIRQGYQSAAQRTTESLHMMQEKIRPHDSVEEASEAAEEISEVVEEAVEELSEETTE
ncbi:MAG: YtxH domain-containing protein [Candidatus Promineifilaceae bacterium]|nr:YtxH domain-containing protein [Candidatus Promineifilaceae bacterium]